MTSRELIEGLFSEGPRVPEPIRTPFICPGAMMLGASRDVLASLDFSPGDYLSDPVALAALGVATSTMAGFDNLSLPFRMTVESEHYGGERVMLASALASEDYSYPLASLDDFKRLSLPDFSKERFALILSAIPLIKRLCPDKPFVADLVGPLSLATTLLEPRLLYKSINIDNAALHQIFEFLTDNSISYLKELKKSGADIISVMDPALSLATFGPEFILQYSREYFRRIVAEARALELPVMLHLCDAALFDKLGELKVDALSFDSNLNLSILKDSFPDTRRVAVIDAASFKREALDCSDAFSEISQAIVKGADIASITCTLSQDASSRNLKAFSDLLSLGKSTASL